MKPADTRCQAVDESGEGGRCDNDIALDTETGTWLVWCEDHQAQETEARATGGERVERVGVGVNPESDSE